MRSRRYGAPERWSSSGVNSVARTADAPSSVVSFHRLPTRYSSVFRARAGVAATPPYASRAYVIVPPASVSITNAAEVMLMSSSRRLLTLKESMRRVPPARTMPESGACDASPAFRGKTTQRTTSSGRSTDLR